MTTDPDAGPRMVDSDERTSATPGDHAQARGDPERRPGSDEPGRPGAPQAGPPILEGTPAYLSPEQIRGDEVDARADLFAFGILLYEMLTGRNPFLRSNLPQTLRAVLNDDPPPPASLRPCSWACGRSDPWRRQPKTSSSPWASPTRSTPGWPRYQAFSWWAPMPSLSLI